MEYITSNKGRRKLGEGDIVYRVYIMGGFCPGGFCLGGFCPGDFVLGGFVWGNFVLEPLFGTQFSVVHMGRVGWIFSGIAQSYHELPL